MCLPNWHEFVIAYFAIGLSGAVLIPLNFRFKPREVEYILNNAGATTVITAHSFGEYALMDMYLAVRSSVPKLANIIVARPKGPISQDAAEFEQV